LLIVTFISLPLYPFKFIIPSFLYLYIYKPAESVLLGFCVSTIDCFII